MLLEFIPGNMLVSPLVPVNDLYHVSITLLVELQSIGFYFRLKWFLLGVCLDCEIFMHDQVEVLGETFITLVAIVTQYISHRCIITLWGIFLLLLVFALFRDGLLSFFDLIWIFKLVKVV